MNFTVLPHDCVSTILSFTSPLDACGLSPVSTSFQSAADSDDVWERFLPSDYRDIVSRSVTPLKFSSKKDLYFLLCNRILIDGGNKSFTLEKSSGKKSYMLSARELSITWSNEPIPMYWIWESIPDSRFSEVAVLRTVWWLEIHGRIETQMLSPNAAYGAYLIMKISENAHGLDSIPSEISVKVGNNVVSSNTTYLRCPKDDKKKRQMQSLFYANRTQMLRSRLVNNGEDTRVLPSEREDGWMEIELGEFFINGGDDANEEVEMSLMEVKGYQLKGGLIIQGIEVRPKH
ncbi:hypothetical protein CsSME_00010658 [Camellia sinensis var. sinensis]